MKNSLENWFFTNFLSDLPGTLSFYAAPQNNTIFHNNFWLARESFRFPLEPLTKSWIFWFIVVSTFSCLELSRGVIRGASRRMGSSFGRGGKKAETSSPEWEKLLYKSGVIFQRYILSEWRQKSKKYLVKNCEKVNFPQRFWNH